MAQSPLDKIHALEAIEKEIITCLQSSGQALQELGKEKSSQKAAENHTQQFLKSLATVESKLSEQINYLTQVSTGQPHEGSGYASAKVLQMAWHRISHARSRVKELEESKTKYTQLAAARQQQTNRPNEYFH
uniref:Mediator of RNA polymerase II transcription subunit 11 n=1 Tax=Tabanus bromius TaxID=304241 RepID=A0A0K8TRL7_TABBR